MGNVLSSLGCMYPMLLLLPLLISGNINEGG